MLSLVTRYVNHAAIPSVFCCDRILIAALNVDRVHSTPSVMDGVWACMRKDLLCAYHLVLRLMQYHLMFPYLLVFPYHLMQLPSYILGLVWLLSSFSGAANGVIVMPSISAVIATVRCRVMSWVFFLLCSTTFLLCGLIRSVGGSSISGGRRCSICFLLWLESTSVGREKKCFHNSHNRRSV